MKLIKVNWSKKFSAITLYPIGVFIRKDKADDAVTINHERIHWEQQKKDAFKFYRTYIWDWIKNGFKYPKKSKEEVEAYTHETDFNYHP